jgi:hypothetical protein
MSDEREEVVRTIRESLPEFCYRNGIAVGEKPKTSADRLAVLRAGGAWLSEEHLDNLAWWVASSMPPRLYREGCAPPGSGIVWDARLWPVGERTAHSSPTNTTEHKD